MANQGNNRYELKIGTRFLDNFAIRFIVSDKSIPIMSFTCDLRQATQFNTVDLKDRVSLVRRSDKTPLFGGHVHGLSYSETSATFICKGAESFFPNLRFSYEFLNTKAMKIAWFVSRLAFKKQAIKFDDIMLNQVDLTPKEYLVITPIKGIVLTGELTVGDVTFYSDFSSLEDQIIHASKKGNMYPEWKEFRVRAYVKVVAEDFYDAIKDGVERVSKAVDLIAFRNDLSFPIVGDDKKLSFSNERYYARVDVSSKVFCKEVRTPETLLFDLRMLEETTLHLERDNDSYFTAIFELFTDIMKSDTELSEEQRITLLSLHWLKLGVYATEPVSKLVNLWHAVEFAAHGLSAEREFSENEIEQIKSKIQEIKVNGMGLSDKQRRILIDKIGQLNDTPLLVRLREFISKNSIPFDDSEFKIIQQARKKRNDIGHGKGNVEIERYELEKLKSLIERIIIARSKLT